MPIPKVKLSSLHLFTIAFMLVISVVNYVAFHAMDASTYNMVQRSMPTAETVQSLLQDLVNQETGVRGYMIAEEPRYLEPYYSGVDSMHADVDKLQQYAQQNEKLSAMLTSQVLPQIDKIDAYFTSQINLVKNGQAEQAKLRVNDGKADMDAFRDMSNALLKLSHDEIGASWARTQMAGLRSQWLIVVAGMIAIGIACVSSVMFNKARKAEAALRLSEERYRSTAENLEAQNEEIIAQQNVLETTLQQLTDREKELEWITTFQQKLTGYSGLTAFLEAVLPALLDALELDAALLLVRDGESSHRILHACGYPSSAYPRMQQELYGPALRMFEREEPLEVKRILTEAELGLHRGHTQATDTYYPLQGDNHQTIGFVLLTDYAGRHRTVADQRLLHGLLHQFSLALQAQLIYEERQRQAERLSQLNEELSAEKDTIRRILESSHEGMVMTDPKGIVRVTNSRVLDYLGADNAFGQPIARLFERLADESAALMSGLPLLQQYVEGNADQLGFRFERMLKNGEQRHMELYATKVGETGSGSGKHDGYLFVIRDRTEEEKVDELKNEFVSIVSHELRTPLASILGFVEILLHRDVAEDKRKRYLTTIFNESRRLSNLINDFLDLQRMESGKQVYHFAPLSPFALLKEVVDQWNHDQSHHQVVLHGEQGQDWMVRADDERLRQVLHNLISNAVKYSPHSDHVDVYIRLEDGRIRIDIRDYGLGIPDDAQGKLFSKFYRVDNSDRRQIGGTGLGLSISKEIVEAHQGELTFESRMGQGSTFSISLAQHHVLAMSGKIVIVENDEGLAGLIEATLQKSNLDTVRYRSAEEGMLALSRVEGVPPLLCIVDLHLEGMKSGWDFIAELHRHPDCVQTPVIISSVLEQPDDYMDTPAEVYMRKPFSIERLLEAVLRLIHERLPNTLVFLSKDGKAVATELQDCGLPVDRIKPDGDFIEVRLKPPSNNI